VGDAVGVRENGIDPMVVVMRERDAQGHVVVEKKLETPRGHRVVERRGFFDERAVAAQALRDPRVSRWEAVRNHPELVGAYRALDSAGKVAEARIANLERRQRFVALVREALAHAAERGEPLPSPQQQARSKADSARTSDSVTQRAPDLTATRGGITDRRVPVRLDIRFECHPLLCSPACSAPAPSTGPPKQLSPHLLSFH
jgi:hypothetical protein